MHNRAADRFKSALEELYTIAKVNVTGVDACIDHYNRYKDKQSSEMLAKSIAYGLRQIHYCRQELLLLTIDQDIAAAKQKAWSPKNPIP